MRTGRLITGSVLIVMVIILGVRWVRSMEANRDAFYARLLNNQGDDVGAAFIIALWLNDDVVYEVTDPKAWNRLDEWMDNHIVQECSIWDSGQLDAVRGSSPGDLYMFSCDAGDLVLENVLIEYNNLGKQHITDWEVTQSTGMRD